MKKKYIIYAPSYTKSNGIRVLYALAEILQTQGFDVFMYALASREKSNLRFISSVTRDMRKNDIVIYPEIVPGNPLSFQNVVRYVLYFPGKLGGDSRYDAYEQIFTFDKRYYANAPVLTINNIDSSLFHVDPSVTKDRDCYFVYKGGKWKEVDELKNLQQINMQEPASRAELARLLQRTKTLYSYDHFSLLLDEAVACGCTVKLITQDGFADYKTSVQPNQGKYDPNQLQFFITKTQNMNYTGNIRQIPFSQQWQHCINYMKYGIYQVFGSPEKKKIYFKKTHRLM